MTPEQRRGRLYVLATVLVTLTAEIGSKTRLYPVGSFHFTNLVAPALPQYFCIFFGAAPESHDLCYRSVAASDYCLCCLSPHFPARFV